MHGDVGLQKDLASQNDHYLFNMGLATVYWNKLQ